MVYFRINKLVYELVIASGSDINHVACLKSCSAQVISAVDLQLILDQLNLNFDRESKPKKDKAKNNEKVEDESEESDEV